jgi:hypothetical protein
MKYHSTISTARHIYRNSYVAALSAFLLLMTTFLSCKDKESPETAVPPVFSVTPVDIAYNPDDSSFGDIMFDSGSPVLTPFGALIPPGNVVQSAAFEYFTIPGAIVRAVTHGVVDTIIDNPDQSDYEVRVVSLPGSQYTVVYNHVLDLWILQGSLVDAGDTIGQAGTWNESTRRTQLLMTTGSGTDRRAYCPLYYGDSSFIALHQQLLAEYNHRGIQPHYDSLCVQSVIQLP